MRAAAWFQVARLIVPLPGGPAYRPSLAEDSGLGPPQVPAAGREHQPGGEDEAPRTVRMATANVLTLRPGEERESIEGSARRIMLEEQFADAGIHLVGVQEARAPQAEVRKGRRYTRVVAGVELWINPKLRIDPDTIFVLHSSPKLLVVSLVWESELTCFAVLHGPDMAYGVEAVPLWWSSTAATLRQVRPAGSPLFVFADTNAKIGSVQSAFVGGHEADQETAAGEPSTSCLPT